MALKTDREIANLKAEDGQRQVVAVASGAGGGLCIEVRSGGRSKTWLYRYRINNKARKFTLGSYPAMSLATARVEHGKAVALVKAGEDPAAVAKASKVKRSAMPTFDAFFEEWLEWKQVAKPARTSTVEAYRHTHRLYISKAIGSLLLKDVTRAVLFAHLSKVRGRSIQAARKALTICAQMLDHAVNLDLIELNPARTIKPSTIGAEAPPPRQRWLCREEIALFWLGLNEGGYHPAQVNCLRLILLTGARRGEATSMTWDQIIGNKWVIPASNAKNGKEHTITLHPLALDVIASQRAISRGSAWVFEAIREHDAGQGHIDGNALRWVLNKVRALTMPQSEIFTVHDLRRTFASCCAEYLDANESVIELALNHSKRDRLVATYQAGKRAEQVARLFELWGDFVFNLISPAQHKPVNVISVDFRSRN
ncbi:TPA: integrase arm-type DNA-binding domain-containing protein [Aeromonas veronii]|nr:integrase arm-type DNA-binding domain-containing protein [Aeromonas veronii]HDO1332381.1 integrase arm-type DNA-binding domain-containing protein [Aeromonas veronii]HDO1340664.1 integrase arm-type DNA-binding domain-containing protein [Aeromonas veronii]HDO1341439.1 integrase arm-type DNA-binding domain-containing protein [Aeromonas veronii]HDO1346013.1 integrase arm-type DNA-binding domain-containing protein [Aeromonas veronii]